MKMTICHVFVMDFHGFAWTILTYAMYAVVNNASNNKTNSCLLRAANTA